VRRRHGEVAEPGDCAPEVLRHQLLGGSDAEEPDGLEVGGGRAVEHQLVGEREHRDTVVGRAQHVVQERRSRGERLGLLELQTLWPFPGDIVRQHSARARAVVVVEMNMGQLMQSVKLAVPNPERVFLANRIDSVFITPSDIMNILRIIQGKGV